MRARREGYHTAFVFNESAPEKNFRFVTLVGQLTGSEELNLTSLAHGQTWRLAFAFEDNKIRVQHRSSVAQVADRRLVLMDFKLTHYPIFHNLTLGLFDSRCSNSNLRPRCPARNYLRVIYDKLGLWNRVELALWYEKHRHEIPGNGMMSTVFFHCDRCHLECRVDSEGQESTAQLNIRHCSDGKDIALLGTVTRFQERRGGVWVDVQRWIDVA